MSSGGPLGRLWLVTGAFMAGAAAGFEQGAGAAPWLIATGFTLITFAGLRP